MTVRGQAMSFSKKNPEGYHDPTAYAALTVIEREETTGQRRPRNRKRRPAKPGVHVKATAVRIY